MLPRENFGEHLDMIADKLADAMAKYDRAAKDNGVKAMVEQLEGNFALVPTRAAQISGSWSLP